MQEDKNTGYAEVRHIKIKGFRVTLVRSEVKIDYSQCKDDYVKKLRLML